MSSPSVPRPNRRWLVLIGVIALVVAGAIVGEGLVSRVRAKRDLVQWTNAQAVPTVSLAALQSGGSQQRLILPGNIQPYKKAAIYARVGGYLKSWEEDIGAHVTAGQTLAVIDTPDLDQQLAQAEANLDTAETNARLAAATAQRYNGLAKPEFVSKQTLDQQNSAAATAKTAAQAARATVGQLQAMESFKTLTAPFDGVVTARNTDVGALINAGSAVTGQELFEVSDLHRVRIYVQVPQAYSAGLQPGVKATFELPEYPGQTFDATLMTTSRALNATSRSMLMELQTDNADGKLFSNAYCRVTFQLPADPNALRVPATALMPSPVRGMQVAILGADNKVTLKPVQTGRDFGDSIEVIAGLAPEDRVIDSPPETLQNGDTVQLAAATPSGQPAQPAPPAPSSAGGSH